MTADYSTSSAIRSLCTPKYRLLVDDNAAMLDTVTCHADLAVELPSADAMMLFTPEGERSWAPGWDPVYPAAARREGRGAVFTTRHGADVTTWVMVDQDERCVRYARFASGSAAGTVSVAVVEATPARTRLRVEYDLTALSPDGARWLEHFAADFDAYIADWERAIASLTG
jgi:hypothetical protein